MFESLKLISRILDVSERILKLFQHRDMNKWLIEVEQAIDEAEKAHTEDEKFAAARNFVHLIRSLH